MRHRNDKEAITIIGDTGESIIPSSKGSEKTEEAAGLDDGRVRGASGVAVEIADAEEEEGEVEGEEEDEEGDGTAEGGEEEDGGEDEPALFGGEELGVSCWHVIVG